jgi:hypothetical protein
LDANEQAHGYDESLSTFVVLCNGSERWCCSSNDAGSLNLLSTPLPIALIRSSHRDLTISTSVPSRRIGRLDGRGVGPPVHCLALKWGVCKS